MTGESDNNRSEGQGGCREALSTKEVCSKGTTVGTRTGSEAEMRAMSVLENAKSNRHRKTHLVEPDGTGRKFMHLTRGDLPRESAGEVSRGRSSDESRGNPEGAKGRRMQETMKTAVSRVVIRHDRVSNETRSPAFDAAARSVDPSENVAGMARCTSVTRVRVTCYSTAGCAKPHVRWCGRVTGRNPRGPIRSPEGSNLLGFTGPNIYFVPAPTLRFCGRRSSV